MIFLFLLQVLTTNVPVNTPFTIAFEHQWNLGDKYRLWCNGSIIKNYSEIESSNGRVISPTTPVEPFTYTFTLTSPPLTKGIHSCFISAYNEVGETKGNPENIIVGAAPSIPVGFRVIVK